jgi:hypothetical protein
MDTKALLNASQFPGKNGGARIQAAIDSLGILPKVIEVGPQGPDLDGCWLLTRPLILPSNTTLILQGARLFLADHVSDNMVRNFHADTDDSRGDENIHILGLGGAELDGNAVNQLRREQVYRNFGLRFTRSITPPSKGSSWGQHKPGGWGWKMSMTS